MSNSKKTNKVVLWRKELENIRALNGGKIKKAKTPSKTMVLLLNSYTNVANIMKISEYDKNDNLTAMLLPSEDIGYRLITETASKDICNNLKSKNIIHSIINDDSLSVESKALLLCGYTSKYDIEISVESDGDDICIRRDKIGRVLFDMYETPIKIYNEKLSSVESWTCNKKEMSKYINEVVVVIANNIYKKDKNKKIRKSILDFRKKKLKHINITDHKKISYDKDGIKITINITKTMI